MYSIQQCRAIYTYVKRVKLETKTYKRRTTKKLNIIYNKFREYTPFYIRGSRWLYFRKKNFLCTYSIRLTATRRTIRLYFHDWLLQGVSISLSLFIWYIPPHFYIYLLSNMLKLSNL